MKKITDLMTAGLLLAAVLAGCEADGNAGDESKEGGKKDGVFSVVQVEEKALLATDTDAPQARAVAKGANGFAFRFGAALTEAEIGTGSDDNLICSPYSVWLPLAALLNATDEASRPALLEAIGAGGLDAGGFDTGVIGAADINTAASRMLYDLTKESDKKYAAEYGEGYYNPLKIANAIFVDKASTLKTDFAQAFADYYRGASINVDFASPDAVEAVNDWASDNTDGLIDSIITQFDPDTVAAIANAIYFSDDWSWQFKPDETEEGTFHAPSGDTKASFMLRKVKEEDFFAYLPYYEDDRVQATPLDFTSGGGMLIILPKDGDAAGLLKSMTADYFDTIRGNYDERPGTLKLPRFSIASDVMDLADALEALGIPLFEGAALTGLLEAQTVGLSSAVQKAMIKVDEKGTTAAAVTVMAGATSAKPGEEEKKPPFTMICDKPFVFVLYGPTTDGGSQVLFTGLVNRPETP
jgi:serpin B